MAVSSVMLTGEAVAGVYTTPQAMRVVAELPLEVKLGAITDHVRRAAVPDLASFYDNLTATPPPAVVDYYTKAARSIARMYANDRMGCCVVSGKAHAFGAMSAADTDSGGEVLGTDQEIVTQYQRWCGPGDNGCYIPRVLDIIRTQGMVLGGKAYKIDGYVTVFNRHVDLVKAAINLFGGVTIGFMVPERWLNAAVWDVSNATGRIVGGHDVEVLGYDPTHVYLSSWGRLYKMTWAAFVDPRWVTECYAKLAPLWYNSDQLAPSGIDAPRLQKALTEVGHGFIPDVTPAPPPPPPPPPGPAAVTHAGPQQDTLATVYAPDGTIIGQARIMKNSIQVAPIAPAGGLPVPWRTLLRDVMALVAAVASRDALAVMAALQKIAADLGLNLFGGTVVMARVKWIALMRAVQQLTADFAANSPVQTLIADLRAIADALGIALPF